MFSVEPEHIYRKVIQFHVYSCDKYARHKQIGETEIRLEDIDLRYLIRLWMNLRDIDEVSQICCLLESSIIHT